MSELKFSFQKIASVTKDGGITGAMSPILSAKAFMEAYEFKRMDALIRVWFDDPEYNNWYEGRKHENYLTGCDTLIFMQEFTNCKIIVMFVDQGVGLCPVFIHFTNDEDEKPITITPVYKNGKYAKKLNEDDIRLIIDRFLEDPDCQSLAPERKAIFDKKKEAESESLNK